MAIPVLDKTWDFTGVNTVLRGDATTPDLYGGTGQGYQMNYSSSRLLWALKEQLKTWGWVVEGSATWGGVYGMDGVDRWVAHTDIPWGTDAYGGCGWIVLKLADADGLGHDFYLLFWTLSENATGNPDWSCADVWTAWTPFTGGTTGGAGRPTSTTELQWLGYRTDHWHPFFWGGTLGGGTVSCPFPTITMHAWATDDHAVQRIVVMKDNKIGIYLAAERVKDPTSSWTNPFVFNYSVAAGTASGITDDAITIALANDAACFHGRQNTTNLALYLSGESHVSALTAERLLYKNEISGEAHFYPIGVVSTTPYGRGRQGLLYDLWWAPQELRTGDTFPADETSQFVVLGDFIFPWPASTAVRTI